MVCFMYALTMELGNSIAEAMLLSMYNTVYVHYKTARV